MTAETFTNEIVAEWLGCTPEQVRLLRLRPLRCEACEAVHRSFPTIVAYHSPICADGAKCSGCGEDIGRLSCEHSTREIGSLCQECFNADDKP